MEVKSMKMVKMLIQVPRPVKAQLDALRAQGYTSSGFIRALLEREFAETTKVKQKEK
jgi:mannitol/fructose-specific phosphotransferase system IIA component